MIISPKQKSMTEMLLLKQVSDQKIVIEKLQTEAAMLKMRLAQEESLKDVDIELTQEIDEDEVQLRTVLFLVRNLYTLLRELDKFPLLRKILRSVHLLYYKIQ